MRRANSSTERPIAFRTTAVGVFSIDFILVRNESCRFRLTWQVKSVTQCYMDVLNPEKSENPSHVDRQAAFSVPEAAEFFGHHPAWVYRRVYLGQLKVMRDGGRIMITRAE